MTNITMPHSPITHLNIVCYKWGNRYAAEEINILHASVLRNLSIPHRFFCITDDPTNLSPEIEVRPLPEKGRVGNGPKIYTFSKDFLGLGPDEYVVSLDVDIVIVGSLDFLVDQPDLDFIIARHRASRTRSRGHGAVYRLRVGALPHIWEDFIADQEGWSAKLPGKNDNPFSEQRWLEYHYKDREMNHFPDNKILIFRVDCNARSISHFLGRRAGQLGLTTAFIGQANLPNKGEAVVSFSGLTKPKDVIYRHHGHLKKAPFVAEHWRL
jgi:hypothetical protein